MAEKHTHTPGPWFVPEGPFVSGLTVETRATDELIECPGSGGAMSLTTTICTLEWSGTPVWEANARLIAQAPAMLEALREAEDHMILMYSGIAGGDAGAGQRFADKDPVVAIVRKVIAAATGEAP